MKARVIVEYAESPTDAAGEKRTVDLVLEVSQFGVTLDQNGFVYMSISGQSLHPPTSPKSSKT